MKELTDAERAKKIIEVKNLLLINEKDTLNITRTYRSLVTQSQVAVELRLEKEQLEHQLEILTGFGQINAKDFVSANINKNDEEGDGGGSGKKELVKV